MQLFFAIACLLAVLTLSIGASIAPNSDREVNNEPGVEVSTGQVREVSKSASQSRAAKEVVAEARNSDDGFLLDDFDSTAIPYNSYNEGSYGTGTRRLTTRQSIHRRNNKDKYIAEESESAPVESQATAVELKTNADAYVSRRKETTVNGRVKRTLIGLLKSLHGCGGTGCASGCGGASPCTPKPTVVHQDVPVPQMVPVYVPVVKIVHKDVPVPHLVPVPVEKVVRVPVPVISQSQPCCGQNASPCSCSG